MQCINLHRNIFANKDGIYKYVPCGKCNFCLQNIRNDWSFRIQEEFKDAHTGHFITLTYNRENVPMHWVKDEFEEWQPYGNTLNKKDLYQFLKSIKEKQKRFERKWKLDTWKIRYMAVGEYGSEGNRPHYHAIMMNVRPEIMETVEEVWNRGSVHVGTVTPKSIDYTLKYIVDMGYYDKELQRPFRTMSTNPGLGNNYIAKNHTWHKGDHTLHPDELRPYRIVEKWKLRLPRYYKDRIFKDDERQEILTESLQILHEEARARIWEEYEKEIEILGLVHPNPVYYWEEKLKAKYDNIRIKAKKSETLGKNLGESGILPTEEIRRGEEQSEMRFVWESARIHRARERKKAKTKREAAHNMQRETEETIERTEKTGILNE